MIPYSVKKIPCKDAKTYIHKYHYSHGSHNGPSPCYGLFDKDTLIGVLMFATPCSENVRNSIFGSDPNSVVELHRLHIKDVTPKNTESFFIGKCLRLLKQDRPQTRAVISFSDSTEGHTGIIYRASNFLFCGTTGRCKFFRDKDGRLRHPRQAGVNISLKEAESLGWQAEMRDSKNRYVYILDKRDMKYLKLVPQVYKTVQ